MPTYNRAKLLPLAIESVLHQTFDDFELVISNGGSTDNTKKVIESFTDSRLHYVESKERLSIGDNYLQALNHSKGEYIIFLGDDDAFVPMMLERMKKIIEEKQAQIVAFRFANYYHDKYVESHDEQIEANTLQVQPFTNELTKFTATEAIENLYRVHGLNSLKKNDKFIVPYLANAVYHNSVFAQVRKINNNPFAATPADMYLAAAVFYVVDSYYCLDEPLHVWSRWSGSSTATAHDKGNALREHYEKLLNGRKLEFTPLKFALPHNCAVNAIIEASDDFGSKNAKDINWLNYYITIYENLMYLKSLKVDIALELEEFHKILKNESQEIKKRISTEINNPSLKAKLFLRNRFPAILKAGKKIINQNMSDNVISINGNENKFENVLQAARFLSEQILMKQPQSYSRNQH